MIYLDNLKVEVNCEHCKQVIYTIEGHKSIQNISDELKEAKNKHHCNHEHGVLRCPDCGSIHSHGISGFAGNVLMCLECGRIF